MKWFVILLATICATCEPITLSPDTPRAVTSEGISVVDYYASWCGPCRRMMPIFKSVAEKLSKRATFYICEATDNVWNTLNIKTIPCIVLYRNGKEIKRTGSLSEQALTHWITEEL